MDMAVDSEGRIHISYSRDGAVYVWPDGPGVAEREVVPATPDQSIASSDMAIDADDRIYVAYVRDGRFFVKREGEPELDLLKEFNLEQHVGRPDDVAVEVTPEGRLRVP